MGLRACANYRLQRAGLREDIIDGGPRYTYCNILGRFESFVTRGLNFVKLYGGVYIKSVSLQTLVLATQEKKVT